MTTELSPHQQGRPEGAQSVLSAVESHSPRGMGTKHVHYVANSHRPDNSKLSMYKVRKALVWLAGQGLIENRSYKANRASWSFITDERRAELEKARARRDTRIIVQERLKAFGIASSPTGGGLQISVASAEEIVKALEQAGAQECRTFIELTDAGFVAGGAS